MTIMKSELDGDSAQTNEHPAGETEASVNREDKSFHEQVREFEREIIAEALAEVGGGVTRAAKNLGLTHQGLCYIINVRHPDLLALRSPLRIRRSTGAKRRRRGRRK